MADFRYPIGRFTYDGAMTGGRRAECVARIATAPGRLRAAVAGLDDAKLDTPYRPGGWTVRQVVHLVPDSHLNAYTRIRLALTEDTPTIKPSEEARWAELPDARTLPVDVSLRLLDALHARWVALLQRLGAAEGGAPASPSGARAPHDDRRAARHVRLARRAPCGAHHRPPRADGVAVSVSSLPSRRGARVVRIAGNR